jgi:leucyl aminopeptidase
MKHLKSVAVAVSVLAIWTCGHNRGQAFVRKDLAARIQLAPDAGFSDRTLWAGHGMRLKQINSGDDLTKWAKDKKLRIVSLPIDSNLSRDLANDPATLVFSPGDSTNSGFALVDITDSNREAELAVAAHAQGSHSCGMLQKLSLKLLPTSSEFTPPLFAEVLNRQAIANLTTIDAGAVTQSLSNKIQTLESIGTRYHTSQSGIQTSSTVQKLFETAAGGRIPGMSVRLVPHIETEQKSVVVTIPGTEDPQATGPVIILGAHIDSINAANKEGDAPGADDDASGVATLVEIVQQIASSGAQFKRTIEFHGYAAEEVGLIGSNDIAESYAASGRTVAAMLQLDMNSWASNPSSQTIYLVTNSTSALLRRSLKTLINTYLGGNVVEGTLPAGTSDHASWQAAGFHSVFPFENPIDYNEALHTPRDTSATINDLKLASRFVQTGLAFLGHHAGLKNAEGTYQEDLAKFRAATAKDLFLAIKSGETGNSYGLSVAAGSLIKSVEICEVNEAGGIGCKRELLIGKATTQKGSRQFFNLGDDLQIRSGIHISVFGYDSNDKLIAQRSVRLQKK